MSSDWEWFERAKGGDESAWRELVGRYAPGLTRMTFLITCSMATAQDLVQETFLELFRKGPRHKRGSFKAYLTTIAYHLALKEKKRLWLKPGHSLDHVNTADRATTPLDGVLSKERDRVIAEVIMSLDSHHRDILIMRFYGDQTYEEIAQKTDLPIGTVKSRLFYAVKYCRERLRGKGILE
ncbi:MAG: RNA polymerase sigma factor [Candidatus Glassbacteria bacterium]